MVLISVVLNWTALSNVLPPHLKRENQKPISIVEWTPLSQYQQKLNIIIFLNVKFVKDLLYWNALNYIGVPENWAGSLC